MVRPRITYEVEGVVSQYELADMDPQTQEDYARLQHRTTGEHWQTEDPVTKAVEVQHQLSRDFRARIKDCGGVCLLVAKVEADALQVRCFPAQFSSETAATAQEARCRETHDAARSEFDAFVVSDTSNDEEH